MWVSVVSTVSQQIKLFFQNLMIITCAWILPSSVTTQCVAVHTTFRWTIASREDINSTTLVAMLKVSWILMTKKTPSHVSISGRSTKAGTFRLLYAYFSKVFSFFYVSINFQHLGYPVFSLHESLFYLSIIGDKFLLQHIRK